MDLNYFAMNPWEKLWFRFKKFFSGFGNRFLGFFKAVGRIIASFFLGIFKIISDFVMGFIKGNFVTKLSYFIMGSGHFTRGRVVRGFAYFFIQIAFILYMALFDGAFYLGNFMGAVFTGGTFGNKVQHEGPWDDNLGEAPLIDGDNSFLFLLYGVVAVLLVAVFVVIYIVQTRESRKIEENRVIGKRPSTFIEDVKSMMDNKFHITLLSLPLLGVVIFTIVPLIAMILIAFTNYDQSTPLNTTLFKWVGFENFSQIFTGLGSSGGLGYTFVQILIWTVIWAFFATFTNYFGGMLLAMLINKKGIKFKKLWRTIFVFTIAVPQFVSLLIMSLMLISGDGTLGDTNVGIIISWLRVIGIRFNFSNEAIFTRIGVIIVNMWIGVPYTMLMCSGILMNIPQDLYESARIDGASAVRQFIKITLPYMLFVTGPYLITQFIGNLNNFNVIYLLSGGGPATPGYDPTAKGADLLVTWLYRLTSEQQNYKLAAVIGILTFVISAVFSLVVYNKSSAVKGEEDFQ